VVPEKFIRKVMDVVGTDDVIHSSRVTEVYSTDASPFYGRTAAVIRPENENEVSEILKLANEFSVSVVPRGGGSGTSGGAVPKDAVVIDMKKMDRIEVFPDDMIVFVEAGAILHDIKNALSRYGLFLPPEPGSLKIATAGGFVANNGSGKRGLKYGGIRNFVVGMNVVLPDGKAVRMPSRTHRSPGIAHQIFTGSEGTLGVITGIYFRVIPLPEEKRTYLIHLKKRDNLNRILREVLKTTPDAVEYMDSRTSSAIGFEPFDLLAVEILGKDRCAEKIMERLGGHVLEGRDEEDFWESRETLGAEIAKKGTRVYAGEDFAVPFSRLNEFIGQIYRIERETDSEIFIYGHLDTCNLHPAIVSKSFEDAMETARRISRMALDMGATIGEHGLALRWEFARGLEIFRRVKYCLDRRNILNPGKFGV